jgi:1-deoxy-D-xylulose-5-phosphate reductoisomerase
MGDTMKKPLYAIDTSNRIPEQTSISLLGATGSIGEQTIDIVLENSELFSVDVISAYSKVSELSAIADKLSAAGKPISACHIYDADAHALAAKDPMLAGKLLPAGDEGLQIAASWESTDTVVNALVGAAGLPPTITAAENGKRIALANKESLVIGGDLVMNAVNGSGAEIVPIDSEHSALAQCLYGRSMSEVDSLILTASGGPFLNHTAEDLQNVALKEVLNHPTWNMGQKITVDSATLMNKGLEVIEAHVLYGIGYDKIEVLVHPGSIVHSLVRFNDGSLLAQLGEPDMRVPILYAISGEIHHHGGSDRLDLVKLGQLNFEKPDEARFPCLRLAKEAGIAGGSATIVLNGANEIAVASLLAGSIEYKDIALIIEKALEQTEVVSVDSLEQAISIDRKSRILATEIVAGL